MRRYMVDPDNEDRLLKIPPHVVAAIKAEALDAAREAVAAVEERPDAEIDYDRDYTADPSGNTRNPRMWLRDALAAIEALKESREPNVRGRKENDRGTNP